MDVSIAKFDETYDAMRGVRSELGRRKRKVTTAEVSELAKVSIERHQSRMDLIKQRLESGFVWPGGMVGAYFIEPFHEVGLISEEEHALRRFVAACPRVYYGRTHERFSDETNGRIEKRVKHSLHAGYGKGFLPLADSKLLALDMPVIELTRTMRHGWRVDLDMDFPSMAYLRDQVQQVVDRGDIPCLPHIPVGHVEHDGTLRRPHLWFLLPYGSQVWYDSDDERCNKRIMALFDGVVRGCAAALLHLGADISAIANEGKGKNPLSPFWTKEVWNGTTFPDLTEWSECVDTGRRYGDLARDAAALDSGLDKNDSNAAFCTAQRIAFDSLRRMHHAGDPEYLDALDDTEALAEILAAKCVAEIGHMFKKRSERKRLMKMIRRVTRYAAGRWDPDRCGANGRDRGACRDLVKGLTTVSERQAVGGRYSAQCKAESARCAVVEAKIRLRETGREVTPTTVAKEAGVSRPTVYKYWDCEVAKDDKAQSVFLRKNRSIDPRIGIEIQACASANVEKIDRPKAGFPIVSNIIVPSVASSLNISVTESVQSHSESASDSDGNELEGISMRDDGTDFEVKRRAIGRQMFRHRSRSIMATSSVESSTEMLGSSPIETPVENRSMAALEHHDESKDVPKIPVTQATSSVDRKASVNTLKPLPLRRRPPVSDRQIEARPFVMDEEIEKFLREWTAEPTVEDLKRMADRRNKRRIPMKGDR